jgi:hypothetical protein
VLSGIFEATRRHRRILLGGSSAVVAAVAPAAVAAPGWAITAVIGPALVAYTLVVVILLVGAWLTPAPAALWVETRPAAFRTPPGVTGVYLGLLLVLCGAVEVAVLAAADVPWWGDGAWRTVLLGVYAVAVVRVILDGWLGTGVRLSPDGLVSGWRSRLVPWAALDLGEPVVSRGGQVLTVRFRDPDLVPGRRRWRVSFAVGNVDGAFLADAVAHYVAHPRDRAGIGTPAGYEQLLRSLGRWVHGDL